MLFTAILLILPNLASAGRVYDCPADWRTHGLECYYFVYFPKQEFTDAINYCENLGASLLTVNSQSEHDFIKNYLKKHDPNRGKWYTSGQRNSPGSDVFHWNDDTGLAFADTRYWLTSNAKNETGNGIVYSFKDGKYGWSISRMHELHHYICEISKLESFKILQQHRTFEYGNEDVDPNLIEMGPKFIIQPKDVVYVSRESSAYRQSGAKMSRKEKEFTSFECVAGGNPHVKYKWFRDDKELSSASNSRYTLSNGYFIISNPNEFDDAGYYQCVVENRFGAILSNPVQLSFGSIGEFSNVQTQYVRADAYEGAMITCSPITYKPAVTYQWIKENTFFIRTDKQKYMFISTNGRLYFSEVTRDDEGLYSCLTTLTSISGTTLATTQPPSRVSMPIQLIVQDKPPKVNWGPIIHNDFIVVFPQPPLRGRLVQLECFAYGSSPINYIWHREDKPLPSASKMSNNNRILTIPNADIADQGIYVCTAYRGRSARTQKKFSLVLSVKPFFQYPLKDQHLNIGSKLIWRCDAKAFPKATYSWYKDGILLRASSKEMKISKNVLIIQQLNPKRDAGMYQCAATNKYGSTFSSAQLRVLAFKPSFRKNPVGPSIWAAFNGNITILCQPEAAPTPEIIWKKNGIEMNLAPGSQNSRVQLYQNGNLFIEKLTRQDAGNYTCAATNSYGMASSSAYLFVQDAITLTRRPRNTMAVINETAFLYCEVSHNKDIDLVYYWKFNRRPINTELDPHYEMAEENGKSGSLLIRAIQFKHQGYYTCVAETPLDSVEAKAYVKVLGPPGAASGVYVEQESIRPFSMRLRWTTGVNRGRPIAFQIIEASTNYEPEWQIVANNIPDSTTFVDNEDKRMVQVSGLNPGTSYRFRVRAVNDFGLGDPSWPSVVYRTPSAPPQKSPSHVGGGGGSVGVLTITWKPLEPGEQAGQNIGYIVYWRKKTFKTRYEKKVLNFDTDHFVTLVGEQNYYLEYEVKVQAFNEKGKGPNSTIETIMSAENLPVGVATDVMCDGYNGSALEVTWIKVPNIREVMKGQVLGYQINYWMDGEEDPLIRFIRYPGQVESGLIIGLFSDTNYWTNVQVYNSAGLGPPSENYMNEVPYADYFTMPVSGNDASAPKPCLNPESSSDEDFSDTNYWTNVQVYNSAGLGPPSENYMNEVPYAAPINYPTEVFVHSHGPNSVRVTWRGIVTTRVGEMALAGYRIRVCGITETIYCNNYYDFDRVSEGIVDSLEKDKIYKLRVLGYSEGGDGKMSEVVYFTLGGTVQFDPKTAEILAHSTCLTLSSVLLYLSTLLSLFCL